MLVSGRDNDSSNASLPTIVPYARMRPSIPKEERRKAGLTPLPRPTVNTMTSASPSPSITSYFHFRRQRERRREMDAGPVPLNDDNATLPPLYEQVLQAGGPSTDPSSG
ncbi:hypothetical protein PM082_003585 [Marasmius tenuissimus]|nr:hypothetical protein PM082_003585 [Marasmius tenuissimus]